jgi:hypothetical protein
VLLLVSRFDDRRVTEQEILEFLAACGRLAETQGLRLGRVKIEQTLIGEP